MSNKTVSNYWMKHYVGSSSLCTLCGNTGHVDTTATAIPPNGGDSVGLRQPCFCPNGQAIRENKAKNEHPSYVQLYRSVNGWQTMLMFWQPEPKMKPEGGFYDVWQTGFGPYGHTKEGYDQAHAEGKNWAENEGLEFKDTPFKPLPEGAPKNVVEAMTRAAQEKGEKLVIVDLEAGTSRTVG
jgi:hypothetical protein